MCVCGGGSKCPRGEGVWPFFALGVGGGGPQARFGVGGGALRLNPAPSGWGGGGPPPGEL